MRILNGFGMTLRKFWSRTVFEGTAVIYVANGHDMTCYQCDYELRTSSDTHKSEVRAARQELRKKGKKPPTLRRSRLTEELVVTFGADVSASRAIETLEAVIVRIKEQGLCIGVDAEGKCVFEDRAGKSTAVANRGL